MVQDKIVMGDIVIKSDGSSVFPKQHSPTGVLAVADPGSDTRVVLVKKFHV